METVETYYGKVRMAGMVSLVKKEGAFTFESVGWHSCGDKYRVDRPKGSHLHLLLFTVKGKGTLRVNGRDYSLTPGTVAFVPKDVPNSYFTPRGGSWEFYWIHPTGAASRLLDALLGSVDYGTYLAKAETRGDLSRRAEEIMEYCDDTPVDLWRVSELVSDLLHRSVQALSSEAGGSSVTSRAIAYIDKHYREHITLDDVAASLFVSTAHLIRTFKKETGRTPHQYILERRLLFASQLLAFGSEPVTRIAERTGFSSSSHLINSFCQAYGCTPLQYRSRYVNSKE